MRPELNFETIDSEEPKTVNTYNLVPGQEWFEARTDGLFYMANVPDKKDPAKKITVPYRLTFDPLLIEGFMDPIDGDGDRGLLVRVGDRSLTVRREKVSKSAEMLAWLHDVGARIDTRNTKWLALYFSAWGGTRVLAYTRTGWQRNGAFCVGEQVIGGEGRVLKTEHNRIPFSAQGSYDEWRDHVLPRIYRKPGWVFGTLVMLSSPLLDRIGAPSGTLFNLYGRSSTGKTDALKAGVGVWGKPTGQQACLQSFRTTVNGIEALAVQSSHIGLALDEVKSADEAVLREGAYLLANGRGKARMKPDGSPREVKEWLVNALLSSEKTIEGIFDAAGATQAAGQVVRAIDVDGETLFPVLPLEEVVEFQQAVGSYYGTAGPELVRRIMAGADVQGMHRAALASLYQGTDGRIQRAASAFALLMAAGQIVEIDAKVVSDAFARWLDDDVEAVMDDFHQMGLRLLELIEARRGSSILELAEEDDNDDWGGSGEVGSSYREQDGWYRVLDGGTEECYLRVEALKRHVFNGLGQNKGYDWLDRMGIIEKRSGRGGRTVRVPVLTASTWAVRIDVEMLRRTVMP